VRDVRITARVTEGAGREKANSILADVHAPVPHEALQAAEPELVRWRPTAA